VIPDIARALFTITPSSCLLDVCVLLAPTFNRPTVGGGYLAPSNGLKVIALGHRKLAGWVNIQSAPTAGD
jgi:hypothetical protein